MGLERKQKLLHFIRGAYALASLDDYTYNENYYTIKKDPEHKYIEEVLHIDDFNESICSNDLATEFSKSEMFTSTNPYWWFIGDQMTHLIFKFVDDTDNDFSSGNIEKLDNQLKDLYDMFLKYQGLLETKECNPFRDFVIAISEDVGMRAAYKANIAMAFSDRMSQSGYQLPDLHKICNEAAEDFLNNLTRDINE